MDHNIRMNIDGVQIIKGQTMTAEIADNLNGFRIFLLVLLLLTSIFSIIVLILTFSLSVNERRREFGILRSIGATRGMVISVVIKEAVIIGISGGFIGVAFSSLILFPFNTYIGDSVKLPYLLPNSWVIIVVIILTLILSAVIPPIIASCFAVKISRSETYLTMRDND